ncbi:unnamed protein product [Coffea canephora]|uniref:Terpene synthase N-terminal domain-containing protein n=1 Tax=Coffea canephora TaxID=49390 RepID=A0A068UXD3_COFCA|nr:unnamed protein product [Coffea canephora]
MLTWHVDYTPQSQLEQLKEDVRTEIRATASNPSQQLQLIDAIQRLGVEYHFQEEINHALRKMHEKHQNWENIDHIYTADLYIRILRLEGFRVSSDIFKKFVDDEGKFGEGLVNDVLGILALYEATHFRLHGDDIFVRMATTFLQRNFLNENLFPFMRTRDNFGTNCMFSQFSTD